MYSTRIAFPFEIKKHENKIKTEVILVQKKKRVVRKGPLGSFNVTPFQDVRTKDSHVSNPKSRFQIRSFVKWLIMTLTRV